MTINCILLAAGLSSRFGSDKLLFPLEGKPMYRHLLDRLCHCRIPEAELRLGVVTREPLLESQLDERGVRWIHNSHSDRGISSSLQLGITLMEQLYTPRENREENRYAFFVCDQPYLREETILGFLRGYLQSGKGIGAVSWQGEPGNPVIFSPRYLPELMALTGDTGGKKVLRRHPEDVWLYPVDDPRELQDMDTADQLTEGVRER